MKDASDNLEKKRRLDALKNAPKMAYNDLGYVYAKAKTRDFKHWVKYSKEVKIKIKKDEEIQSKDKDSKR